MHARSPQGFGTGLKAQGLISPPPSPSCGPRLATAVTCRPKGERPFVAAQRYVCDPLLLNGRKFGIRVWVLVVGTRPLRLYLHTNGLVLFSHQPYRSDAWAAPDGSVAQARCVRRWRVGVAWGKSTQRTRWGGGCRCAVGLG